MRVIRNVIPTVYQMRIKQMMEDVGFPWGYLKESHTERQMKCETDFLTQMGVKGSHICFMMLKQILTQSFVIS